MLKFNKKVLKENDDVPEAPEIESAGYDKEVFALICSELKRSGWDCKHTYADHVIIDLTAYDGKVKQLECESVQDLKGGDKLVTFELEGKSCVAIVSPSESKANVSDILDTLNEMQRLEYQKNSFAGTMESVDKFGFPIFEDVKSGNEGYVEAGNALEKPKTTVGKDYDEDKLSDKEIKPDDPKKDPAVMQGTTAKVDNSEKDLEKSAVKPGDPEDKPKVMSEAAKKLFKAKMEARAAKGKTLSEEAKKRFKAQMESKSDELRRKKLAEARRLRRESLESGNEGPVEAGNELDSAKTQVGKEYDENEFPKKEVKPDVITKEVKPEMAGTGASKGDGEGNFPDAKIKPDDISKDKDPAIMGENSKNRKARIMESMKAHLKTRLAKKK